jgi:uncharacterized repeat protein (TIGR02543 family)
MKCNKSKSQRKEGFGMLFKFKKFIALAIMFSLLLNIGGLSVQASEGHELPTINMDETVVESETTPIEDEVTEESDEQGVVSDDTSNSTDKGVVEDPDDSDRQDELDVVDNNQGTTKEGAARGLRLMATFESLEENVPEEVETVTITFRINTGSLNVIDSLTRTLPVGHPMILPSYDDIGGRFHVGWGNTPASTFGNAEDALKYINTPGNVLRFTGSVFIVPSHDVELFLLVASNGLGIGGTQSHTVRFDIEGPGSFMDVNSPIVFSVPLDMPWEHSIVVPTVEASQGARFVRWERLGETINFTHQGPIINGDTITHINENMKFTAVFEYINDFTVHYNTNGGEPKTIDSLSDVSWIQEGLLPKEPTKAHYIFAGWNTSWDGSGRVATDASTYAFLANDIEVDAVTLYAQWKVRTDTPFMVLHMLQQPDETYEVGLIENMTGTTGTLVTATLQDFTGYVFYEHADTVTEGVIAGDESLVLRLFYNRSIHTVSFVNWDETVLSTQDVSYGNAAIPPAVPAREGYIFTGWDGDYNNVTDDIAITTLYEEALPSGPAMMIVRYNSNYSGVGQYFLHPYKPGEEFAVGDEYIVKHYNHLTKSGSNERVLPKNYNNLVFTGWNTKPDGSGTHYNDGDILLIENVATSSVVAVGIEENNISRALPVETVIVNLYAQWELATEEETPARLVPRAPKTGNMVENSLFLYLILALLSLQIMLVWFASNRTKRRNVKR